MPSASSSKSSSNEVIEGQTTTSNENAAHLSSAQQMVQIIEHKVRNLEKRKVSFVEQRKNIQNFHPLPHD